MLLNACHLSPMGDEIVTSVSPWYVVRLHGLYAFGWTSLIAFQERLLTLSQCVRETPLWQQVPPLWQHRLGLMQHWLGWWAEWLMSRGHHRRQCWPSISDVLWHSQGITSFYVPHRPSIYNVLLSIGTKPLYIPAPACDLWLKKRAMCVCTLRPWTCLIACCHYVTIVPLLYMCLMAWCHQVTSMSLLAQRQSHWLIATWNHYVYKIRVKQDPGERRWGLVTSQFQANTWVSDS